MISVSSMHLNAAAEQSPSRASLGIQGVSLRHWIVAVVWLGTVRRWSLPRISLRFGIADRRPWRRNDRLVGYGHDFLLLAGKTRVSFRLFKRWCREEMLFSSSELIAADGLGP